MATTIPPTAGKLLCDAMKAAGFKTQRDLAEAAGVDPKYVSEMCSGKKPITPQMSVALSVPLKIPPEQLAVAWTEQRVRVEVANAKRIAAALS